MFDDELVTVKAFPLKVKFDSPFNVFAVPDPVIILLSALLFIVVDVTAANVESPLKNVDELAVPDPNLAVGTVPDARFDAFKAVMFAPDPENAPENVVAVVTPVANTSPSGLKVIPVPTFTFPLTVVIPVANISPSLLKVIPLPTTIPFLAVINPTESTLVTSS